MIELSTKPMKDEAGKITTWAKNFGEELQQKPSHKGHTSNCECVKAALHVRLPLHNYKI